ncbi:peptidoglycan recognition protein family protein [Tepidibacter mesophilus]|uniref:peptidoglycan recognition protein family protein n=1 Tax=Tepidibacter mesophilus TaxID=655607 RepID=UPI000C06D05F|nr:peptidoglycan recognition family protein [Tepidibacter mesophilus]
MNKTHIVIHHSATDTGDIESFRRYHISKGWRDVGYHYVINKEGSLQKGRVENDTAAACKEAKMNYKGIHICLTGNFDNYEPNNNQFATLIKIVNDIMKRHNIPTNNIKKHTDYAHYKSCPGLKFPWTRFINIMKGEIKMEDNDLTSAINKLVEKGVIDSPNYWINNGTWKKEYVELLIKKFATYIN